jgi:hypothetical protein
MDREIASFMALSNSNHNSNNNHNGVMRGKTRTHAHGGNPNPNPVHRQLIGGRTNKKDHNHNHNQRQQGTRGVGSLSISSSSSAVMSNNAGTGRLGGGGGGGGGGVPVHPASETTLKQIYLKHRYFLFFDFMTFKTLFAYDIDVLSSTNQLAAYLKSSMPGKDPPIPHLVKFYRPAAEHHHHHGKMRQRASQAAARNTSTHHAPAPPPPPVHPFTFTSYEAMAYSAFVLFNQEIIVHDDLLDEIKLPENMQMVNASLFLRITQQRSGLPFERKRVSCAFSLVPEIDEELVMNDIPAMKAYYAEHPKVWQQVSALVESQWKSMGLIRDQRDLLF